MQGLYSVAEIRAIEQAASAALPAGTLMRRAGQAAGNAALELLGAAKTVPPLPVLVLAGPGNNGGDALEVAAVLSAAAIEVVVIHLAGAAPSPETRAALKRAEASDAEFVDTLPPEQSWSLIIDGLFGIGLGRALEGAPRALVETINSRRERCPILALDVPSGLDADTGAVVGADGAAMQATHTMTFIANKPGLHTCAGRDHCGAIMVATLGIDEALYPPAQVHLNSPSLFAQAIVRRPHNSHKGSYGDVVVAGGAQGMAGAAILAARAALYCGAGRVFVASLADGPGVDTTQPELMFRDAAGFKFDGAAIAAGPGMGSSDAAQNVLARALAANGPLLLDADALNLVAAQPELLARVAARPQPVLVTPHPLEAARLLGVTSAVVQGDRLAAARELAVRLNAVVVLKGSGTVIARPDGEAVINTTGNPGLATGGTGDVLAGLCASLLAQGLSAWQAALAGVWLHGAAADTLVAQGAGPIGLTAGELPLALRTLLNKMPSEYHL